MAQWRTDLNTFKQPHNVHLYELGMLATVDGMPATQYNPFPVGIYPGLTGADVNSKRRLRVSDYETVFFNTFQYGIETDVWDQQLTSGGNAVHNLNTSNIIMSVNNTTGSECIRQTRNVMRYIPGRSTVAAFAIKLDTPVVGIRRRFGTFDENNGIYFEDAGDNYYCVIRSKASGVVLETRIPRSEWNGDKLDGTGYSKVVADPTKQQLVVIEYEWYGAGQVKFGFVLDGIVQTVHTFNHGNILNNVWCSTPFLPIRVEITNVTGVAGTHYLYQGSNSVTQDGNADKLGIVENISSPITGTTLTTANVFYPVLSFRLKPTALQGIIIPQFFQAGTIDNTNLYYKIIKNATLTGSSWVDMADINAFTQYDVSSTAVANGVVLDSGFMFAGNTFKIDVSPLGQYQLGRSGMGTVSDTITVAVAASGANKSAVATATWVEQR